ncbi:MAG: hypothetical protein M3018_12370, partial [Actinomycetota bacterium]|nr:hypothetical protein [Actinomycetota bacterium]
IARDLPGGVAGLLFVDACLPPARGSAKLAPATLAELIRALERDGLETDSSWFRQELPLGIGPAGQALAAFMDERPRIPLSYFQERVPMPRNWTGGPCAYLCLSDAYTESASQARAYGWPVAAIRDANHLSLVTDPEAVTSVLLDLASELYRWLQIQADTEQHHRRPKTASARARRREGECESAPEAALTACFDGLTSPRASNRVCPQAHTGHYPITTTTLAAVPAAAWATESIGATVVRP